MRIQLFAVILILGAFLLGQNGVEGDTWIPRSCRIDVNCPTGERCKSNYGTSNRYCVKI